MNVKQVGSADRPDRRRPPFWRSSVYDEPTWVSLAWILGPTLVAGLAIYGVLR